jgi:hypothetical protein
MYGIGGKIRERRITVLLDKTLSSGECPDVSNDPSSPVHLATLDPWKMKALCSFETSVTTHPTKQCHISEDLTHQQHRCASLKWKQRGKNMK